MPDSRTVSCLALTKWFGPMRCLRPSIRFRMIPRYLPGKSVTFCTTTPLASFGSSDDNSARRQACNTTHDHSNPTAYQIQIGPRCEENFHILTVLVNEPRPNTAKTRS